MAYGDLLEIETTDGQKVSGFPVQIPNSPTGPKTAVLRLPTNAELMEYLGAQRSQYKDLGRRMGETIDVPNPKADLKLFNLLRIDKAKDGEEWDASEALYALGVLTQHRITDSERDGQTYRITLNTLFGETVHVVSIPFQKDLAEYRRSVVKARDLPNGVTEQRFPPEVPCRLYDKVWMDMKGYVSTNTVATPTDIVPPHHKRAVIVELLSQLALLDPGLDPNS